MAIENEKANTAINWTDEMVKRWPKVSEDRALHVEPGSPWENAYSETFTSRLGGNDEHR